MLIEVTKTLIDLHLHAAQTNGSQEAARSLEEELAHRYEYMQFMKAKGELQWRNQSERRTEGETKGKQVWVSIVKEEFNWWFILWQRQTTDWQTYLIYFVS